MAYVQAETCLILNSKALCFLSQQFNHHMNNVTPTVLVFSLLFYHKVNLQKCTPISFLFLLFYLINASEPLTGEFKKYLSL